MAPRDTALIAQILGSGDLNAFAVLLRRHQSGIRVFLLRLTRGNQALSDDLAQEVFLSAFENLEQFCGHGSFASWLYTIAYRVFLKNQKARVARKAREKAWQFLRETHQKPFPFNPDLERALSCLKSEEQATITLCLSLGYTIREAGEILDMPPGTVKSHIKRGKDKLAIDLKHLKKEWS